MIDWSIFDYERGPIRPPSESRSLFFRVVRNCPWNRCTFCPVYKNTRFQARSVPDILADIDSASRMISWIQNYARSSGSDGTITRSILKTILHKPDLSDAFRSTAAWLHFNTGAVFLQDADALVMRTDRLEAILKAVRGLPGTRRVTAYSRLSTCARLGPEKLHRLRDAGLDRVHAGLESGSDSVLQHVKKGVTSTQHIDGGNAVKHAGLELSIYVMPGLGGHTLTKEHARETARVLSVIEPDYVRLRSLAVIPGTPLYDAWRDGDFQPLPEEEVLREIRDILDHLTVRYGRLESDHVLNLLPDLSGNLPADIPALIARLDEILDLPEPDRTLFKIGKRMGFIRNTEDLGIPSRRTSAEQILETMITDTINPDQVLFDWMQRMLL
jgi:Radical SAM superfamily